MTTYTITLSDAEDKALGVVALSQNNVESAAQRQARMEAEQAARIEAGGV